MIKSSPRRQRYSRQATSLIIVSGALAAVLVLRAEYRQSHLQQTTDEIRHARHIPGLAVAVMRNGSLEAVGASGSANVELNVQVGPDSVFQIASVTKPFTAAVVMRLVEKGLMRLDDSVSRYVSKLPPAWGHVSVRQALTHTSGVPSYDELPDYEHARATDVSPAEILADTSALPVHFKPGQNWEYSNTGYHLLGLAVESVAKSTFAKVFETEVRGPAGLRATHFNRPGLLVMNRVQHYTLDTGELSVAPYVSPNWSYTAGAVVASASDIARFLAAIDRGDLLKPATVRAMLEPATLQSGDAVPYGLGWFVGQFAARRVAFHSGDRPGVQGSILYFPDDHLGIVVLANRSLAGTGVIARRVAERLLPGVSDQLAAWRSTELDSYLRGIVASLANGTARPAQFVPEVRQKLFPAGSAQIRKYFSSLGPLGEFTFIDRPAPGSYKYEAMFGLASITLDISVDENRLVRAVAISSE